MNDIQNAIIFARQSWLHFIGGYYQNTDKFINEAIRSRISRRAPAQTVRGMQFGDRLILLRYLARETVYAFAEAQIIGVTFDHEVAAVVGERLVKDGKAQYHDGASGGQVIERECGSYLLLGTWIVECSLEEIIESALEIAKEQNKTLFVMVNAELTKIYDQPTYLVPVPKFTRGFTRVDDLASYSITEPSTPSDKMIFSIQDYSKAKRPSHPALPTGE